MVVGEAPGAEEVARGEPFVGSSGYLLTKMLEEAGISRSGCFITNVCRIRPPNNAIEAFIAEKKKDRTPAHQELRGKWVLPPIAEGVAQLEREIALVRPKAIIALGNVALWALTSEWGITKWRGSLLSTPDGIPVIPTYHPAAILRQWSWRVVAVQDLRRAATARLMGVSRPRYEFITRPSFDKAISTIIGLFERLRLGPLRLSVDIETRAGHIACIGLAWTATKALCIPLMQAAADPSYWSEEEETVLMWHLHRLLTHPRCHIVGQNFLYDAQYFWRWLHYIPNVEQDTMLSQHCLFPGLPKSLDFIASMYCSYYRFWKDEGKNWDPKMGEDQLWAYNCQDCTYTLEAGDALLAAAESLQLSGPHEFQQAMFWPTLRTMIRGCRIDKSNRGKFALELQEAIAERETWLAKVLDHPLNVRSSAQMKRLFYDDLKLPVRTNRKTGQPSLDDNALQELVRKEPLIEPIVKRITEIRSLGVFLSTFIQMPLDIDERMRTAYNIAGTETFRFSSRENAFGSGGNLQNLPKGDEAAGLPNVRSLFLPDHGQIFFDMDLDRADLQVVVWEADDAELKSALRKGVDIHLMNAATLNDMDIPIDELVESHPQYPEWKAKLKRERQFAKSFIHGTNYGGSARTMAINCSVSVAQAERAQHKWFGAHPGIKHWHERTEHLLRTKQEVTNAFGYRRHYFDRVDGLLPEALAWIPQSTVALYINAIWLRVALFLPELEVLLQVHDSLAGQFPAHLSDWVQRRLREEAAKVVIPYSDPLVIPVGIQVSGKSWGDVK
jgi:DNA polymerase